eukprot:CAMPEP_0172515648 /NCGR_PEP_ID=MMETSP1066-20121228/269621_1 /TAXON_ID=671091 /ORGANISM="Coscinodiscus wailesii, Strain CCMP2513" /LENGTH=198 /DNA_ID=CAMNT_0013296775 /DNA_START=41 /DNA_END=637 /DNA_ORIENTATION=+
MIPMYFAPGDYLFKQGEEGDCLYILEKGRIDLNVNDDDKTVFSVTKPGDLCGEHALIMNRPRNVSAKCTSPSGAGCDVYQMKALDFYKLLDESSYDLKKSMKEICYRREFQKALVVKTGKSFPSVKDLRQAFDAVDSDKHGTITVDAFVTVLKDFDATLTQEEINEIMESMTLVREGEVTFEEFKHIFGMDDDVATSI